VCVDKLIKYTHQRSTVALPIAPERLQKEHSRPSGPRVRVCVDKPVKYTHNPTAQSPVVRRRVCVDKLVNTPTTPGRARVCVDNKPVNTHTRAGASVVYHSPWPAVAATPHTPETQYIDLLVAPDRLQRRVLKQRRCHSRSRATSSDAPHLNDKVDLPVAWTQPLRKVWALRRAQRRETNCNYQRDRQSLSDSIAENSGGLPY
jgi:hypothetical protein